MGMGVELPLEHAQFIGSYVTGDMRKVGSLGVIEALSLTQMSLSWGRWADQCSCSIHKLSSVSWSCFLSFLLHWECLLSHCVLDAITWFLFVCLFYFTGTQRLPWISREILNSTETIKDLGTFEREWMHFTLWDGHEPMGARDRRPCSKCEMSPIGLVLRRK